MKVISTNISSPKTIVFNGVEEVTGHYKTPVLKPIYLGKEGVSGDHVADQIHHGGADKACYLYSTDHYAYWQALYPDLEWNFGIFGENLSIEGLDESLATIGSIWRVGKALVQVAQPRQPCYKLGIRFKDPAMLPAFLKAPYPGIYVRVLEPGHVQHGDACVLLETIHNAPSVLAVYRLLYAKNPDQTELRQTLENPALATDVKLKLRSKLNS